MAKTLYAYEVRFRDRGPVQGVTYFDPVKNPGDFTSLGVMLRTKYPEYYGVTYRTVPKGGVTFPLLP